ncbi:MAG: hypothetical protein L3J98_17175 [Gammaproteobacteria bacterium]|nr:hypothetical protein [Gammaproteobacteria bacterium]MCF6261859.1 hypothetical protein [Gammaproteobacteria bacterium]
MRDIENEFDIEIAEFNSFKFLRRVIYRAELFGFSYAREPCFFYSTQTFHPDCDFGRNSDAFLFFDEKHTSAKGNKLIGNALFELVNEFDWEVEDKDDDHNDEED